MPQAIQQGAASYDSGYQSNKSYDDWFNADLIQQSSFDWNKVMKIDYDYSFYDLNNTNSEMVLKYNDDYVDASLMA
jgi:hypothetical protein